MSVQMKQTIRHSFIVFIWALLIAALYSLQYSSEERFTIFFLNKTFANLSIVLFGISYLLGPVCILFPKMARHLAYRRYFGVFGFIALVLHTLFSFLQWTTRFPFSWYVDHRLGVTAAVIAFIIFSELAFISHNTFIKELGAKHWKFLMRLGYIGMVFGLFHIYVASGERWSQWLAGEVSLPNSFITFCIGVLVIVVRILAIFYDSMKRRTKH